MRIGKAGISAFGNAQNRGRSRRLLAPDVGTAPGTGFAGGQIENGGRVALVNRLEQGACAGEFDVVPVGGNGKEVDWHDPKVS